MGGGPTSGGRARRAPTPRLLIGLGTAALLAGACGSWGYARSGAGPGDLVRDLSVGWTYAAAGLVARYRRPANRTGDLLLAEGISWFLGNLQGFPVPWLFAVGAWGEALNMAVLAHLLLVFPDGRAGTAGERRLMVAGYALVAAGGFARVLLYDPAADRATSYLACPECGPNPLLLRRDPALFDALDLAYRWAGVVLTALVLVTMVRRWRRASPARRRVLLPAWVAVGIALAFVGWEVLYLLAPESPGAAGDLLTAASDLSQLAVPAAFLTGLLRMRLRRASVGDLLVAAGSEPTPHRLQEVLRQVLGDPSLRLGLPAGDGSVTDPEGRPLTGGARAVTRVDAGPGTGAVLEHDSAVGEDPALLAAAGAAVRFWLSDHRLRAELAGQARRTVPRRLLQAAYEERRRLERDLHDGAQTRLLYTLMTLRRLGTRLPGADDPELRRTVAEAEDSLRHALEELRDLARGIHPAVLTRAGLEPALASLAERSPVPVQVDAEPGRHPQLIETTAYFVVSEALANAVRHAAARRVAVRVRHGGRLLVVEVEDDGVGGAPAPPGPGEPAEPGDSGAAPGTGLRGLADRVAAVGGTLRVDSPPGAGTRIRAELPCE
ncbi:histidine kinase [Streptomyces sp. LP05-1]|uniref:histidine kinase n=1 Tax=Streptomyces pyxinae TaxID=2970734 RepID=A0ABT2CMG7_9ACTN|nr:ATP-binding protein [Streptomyces sp. LP05-1]MCS0638609.1 histidine kinase [Streptomyces sp. LP05-1]